MTGTNNKNRKRVSVFVDGFNLYHAIDDLGRDHLKWLDLFALVRQFCDPNLHQVSAVWYFSAFAVWRPAHARHIQYVRALESTGVRCVMGKFKDKEKRCPSCTHKWVGHEEKESDVNLAIHLLHEAHQNTFDEAVLITRDSDLAPAVRLVRAAYPDKTLKILSPPNRRHSKELAAIAHKLASISEFHLSRALLPKRVVDGDGHLVTSRPERYDPPEAD